MKINERLKTIGDLVPLSTYPLDVGCDHAMLSIYLIKEKGFQKVMASDNKQGPLDSAKINIEKYQVEKNITLYLADGLENLDKDIDTITISGMGGILINQIIERQKDHLENMKHFILSPNNHVDLVRKKLISYGYMITDEKLVKEKNFIYEIICFTKGRKKYKQKQLYLGPILAQNKDELVLEFYKRRYDEQKQLLKLLPSSYFSKRRQVKRNIKWLEQELQ